MKKVGKHSDFYTSRGCTTRVNKWRIKLECMVGIGVPRPAAFSRGEAVAFLSINVK